MAAESQQMMPAAKRRRLQQCFEQGSKVSAKGDFDYATDMFMTCVLGDPGNLLYAQNFIGNLLKKYNNNKKGSKFAGVKGAGQRGLLKKATMQKDWPAVLKTGLELLKLNPWDGTVLTAMAQAAEQLGHDDVELLFLRTALDANPRDPEMNRLCGQTLARMERFDDALHCWHRVLQSLPDDEEAKKAIGDLTVQKTIHKGGYEKAESSTDVMVDKAAQAERQGVGPRRLTPEEALERQIAKDPSDMTPYLELAELYGRKEEFDKAEDVLKRALAVSDDNIDIRERLEDAQLADIRRKLASLEKALKTDPSEENKLRLAKGRALLNSKEMEVYAARSERYPTNLGLKYELGLRLVKAKQYNEAIKYLQEARQDPRRKGAVLLALGECFQQIKQYKLALSNYEAAVEETSDNDVEQKKLALYRAGKLALGLKSVDQAEKLLTDLAGYDFSYRDVPTLLDKIREIRDKG